MSAYRGMHSEKTELERYLKYFIIKGFQVIGNARINAEKVHTECNILSKGSEWYNLAIDEMSDIMKRTKQCLSRHNLLAHTHINMEVSLTTDEGETMVLEVWTIRFDPSSTQPVKIKFDVYKSLGRQLRSLYMLTRAIKIYKLTRGQTGNGYKMDYRIYMGTPHIASLGEHHTRVFVGSSASPFGTVSSQCIYRTKLEMSASSAGEAGLQMKENHFNKPVAQAIPARHSSQNILTDKQLNQQHDGMDGVDFGMFATSPPPEQYLSSSPKSNMFRIGASSSENTDSSGSGGQSRLLKGTPEKTAVKRFRGAFMPRRASQASLEEDVPFSILLEMSQTSHIEPIPLEAKADSRAVYTSIFDDPEFVEFEEDKPEYVLINARTPFAAHDSETDLSNFYQSCKSRPELQSSGPTILETLNDVDLGQFENDLEDFNEFFSMLEVDCKSVPLDGSPV